MKLSIKTFLITFLVVATFSTTARAEQPHPIIKEVYEAFQTGQLERWDAVMHKNVVINSSAGFGNTGLDTAKGWANGFLEAFAPRVDLVDYINAINENGDGRAVLTFNLNWKHIKPFFGVLQPTGRAGTSVENMIMTVRNGKVVRMEIADTTLDLVIYMHENGWKFPQNIAPQPIIKGVERSSEQPIIKLRD